MTRWHRASTLLLAGFLTSCETPAQRLSVELSGTPVATRFIVPGNCSVGWFLSLPLRIRGENASTVVLESMNLGVEDARTGRLLGQDDIALDVQLPGGSGAQSVDVSVGLRIAGNENDPAIDGPVVARGEARGHDADGTMRVPFRLDMVPVIAYASPPNGGPCSAPP